MIIEYFGHPLCTFINRVHQKWFTRSSPSPQKKEKKPKENEPAILLEQKKKKKKDKRAKMEKPKSNTTQRTFIPHTYMHMTKF